MCGGMEDRYLGSMARRSSIECSSSLHTTPSATGSTTGGWGGAGAPPPGGTGAPPPAGAGAAGGGAPPLPAPAEEPVHIHEF